MCVFFPSGYSGAVLVEAALHGDGTDRIIILSAIGAVLIGYRDDYDEYATSCHLWLQQMHNKLFVVTINPTAGHKSENTMRTP